MDAEKIMKALNEKDYSGKDHYGEDVKHVYESMAKGTFSRRDFLCDDLCEFVEAADPEKEEIPLLGRNVAPDGKTEEEVFLMLHQVLSLENAPLGKWPGAEALSLWQQAEVNLAARKGEGEVFEEVKKIVAAKEKTDAEKAAVIKAILADNLVERASLLAKYDKPDDAFESFDFYHGEEKNHAYAEYPAKWHRIREDRLNDHSLLFSSESGAFEEKAIKALSGKETEAGMPCAKLDGKADLAKLYETVLEPMIKSYRDQDTAKDRLPKYTKAREEFLAQKKLLEELQAKQGVLQQAFLRNWKEEKQRRKNLREAEAEIEHGRKDAETAEKTREPLLEERDKIAADMEEVLGKLEETGAAAQAARNEWTRYNDLVRTGFDREQELRNSVSGLAKIFSKKKYEAAQEEADKVQKEAIEAQEKAPGAEKKMKELAAQYDQLSETKERIGKAQEALLDKITQLNKTINGAKQIIARREEEVEQLKVSLESIEKEKAAILEGWSKEEGDDKRVLLDPAFVAELLSKDEKTAEKRRGENPWFSKSYEKEQEKLFTLSLVLQKAFVEASGCCMENLATLCQYLGLWKKDGKAIAFHEADREETVPFLWQTLFLSVPALAISLPNVAERFADAKKPGLYGTVVLETSAKTGPEKVIGVLYRGRNALDFGADR